jgi:hypothetical protein
MGKILDRVSESEPMTPSSRQSDVWKRWRGIAQATKHRVLRLSNIFRGALGDKTKRRLRHYSITRSVFRCRQNSFESSPAGKTMHDAVPLSIQSSSNASWVTVQFEQDMCSHDSSLIATENTSPNQRLHRAMMLIEGVAIAQSLD